MRMLLVLPLLFLGCERPNRPLCITIDGVDYSAVRYYHGSRVAGFTTPDGARHRVWFQSFSVKSGYCAALEEGGE